MSSIIAQSELVAQNMDDMHNSHVFDLAGVREAIPPTRPAGVRCATSMPPPIFTKPSPLWRPGNQWHGAAQKNGFKFYVPSRPDVPARNPKNNNGAEFSAAFAAFAKGEPEFFFEDRAHDGLVLARPVRLQASCLSCHGDPAKSATGDGKDVLGFPMENLKLGDIKGAFVLEAGIGHDPVVTATMNIMALVGGMVLLVVLTGLYFFNQHSIVRPLTRSVRAAAGEPASKPCRRPRKSPTRASRWRKGPANRPPPSKKPALRWRKCPA